MQIKPEHRKASEYMKIFTKLIFDINKKYLCSVSTFFPRYLLLLLTCVKLFLDWPSSILPLDSTQSY